MRDSVRRSWLIIPVSEAEQVAQASTAGADVVVLDLMEFVPEQEKPAARERVPEAIGAIARSGADVFVQIDTEVAYADLSAAVWPGLHGVMIPRVESPQDIVEVEALVSHLEDERGFRPGALQVVAVVDTAKGNYAAVEIARASPRVWGITLGRADLVMDLRPEPSGEFHSMPYLMQRLIIVAHAAGLVPLGAWWRAPARGLLASPEETYQAAVRGRRIGFQGALCLRTHQVEPLNRGFTPAAAELERARQLAAAYAEVTNEGGAYLRIDDRIVDRATAGQATQLLAYAEACARRDAEKTQARQRAAR